MTDTTTPSVRSPSDAELITLARAGDDHAYSELYRRHEGSARAAARSLTRSKADVDDLVADGFVRVLQALRSGKGPEVAFRPYLLTAVRNAFYDRLRKDKRVDVTDEPPEHVNVQLLDMAASEEDRALIARAFASLPERWQVVLWHAEVEGRTATEIGLTLGLAPNAVAALAYRAREGLRQAYLQAHLQREVPQHCKEPRSNLGGYVRNALSGRDHRKVETHLDDCSSCRALLGELNDANRQLRIVLIPLLVGVPAAKYLAGIGAGKGLIAVLRRSPRSTQVAAGTAVVAAAAAALFVAVSMTGRIASSDSEPQTAPSAAAIVETSARSRPTDSVSTEPIATDTNVASESVPPSETGTTSTITDPGGALPLVPDAVTTTTALVLSPSTASPRPTSAARPTVASTTPSATAAPRPSTTVAVTSTTSTTTTAASTTSTSTAPSSTSTSVSVSVPVQPALVVSVSSEFEAIGGQFAYLRITVENPAASPGVRVARAGGSGTTARTPQVVLELPAGTELASTDAFWRCELDGRFLRCTLPDVAAGATVSGIVEVRLQALTPSEIPLQPTVSAAGFSSSSVRSMLRVADGQQSEYFRRIRGGIATIGNSSLVCADSTSCDDARAGVATGELNRRQLHEMGYVDIDDLATTFNSSSADLTVPSSATIEKAVLVWSAETAAGPNGSTAPDSAARGEVSLAGPDGVSTVVAHRVDDDGTRYVAYADVTAAMSSTGRYTVGNIQAGVGEGRFAGWSLMVVYRHADAPPAVIAITAEPGLSRAINGVSHRVPVGVVSPSASERSGSLTWVAFEGDRTLVNESAQLNGIALPGPIDHPTDLFDSSIPGSRLPADANTFGVDVDTFAFTMAPGESRLDLSVTTPVDRVRWGLAGWTLVAE